MKHELWTGRGDLAAHKKGLGTDTDQGLARVNADALTALGRAEEAAALRERYAIGADPPSPP
jgi:hypothetical protein